MKNVRVELVFILLHARFQYDNVKIKVDEKDCISIRAYGARKGNHFECRQPVTGTRLWICWPVQYAMYIQLCEEEVFQTKIRTRPTKSLSNEKESYIGCDQRLDAGEDSFGKGRHVASLVSPTKEPVQTMILPKNIIARFVTLALQNEGLELQYREVKIYNGPLLALLQHEYSEINRGSSLLNDSFIASLQKQREADVSQLKRLVSM